MLGKQCILINDLDQKSQLKNINNYGAGFFSTYRITHITWDGNNSQLLILIDGSTWIKIKSDGFVQN